MLSRQALADKLDVSTRTVDRIRYSDPHFPQPATVGGVLRWREADVDRWIDGKIPQAAPAGVKPGRRKSAAELLA